MTDSSSALSEGLAERLAEQQGRIPTDDFSYGDDTLVHRGWIVEFHRMTIIDDQGNAHGRDVIRHPGAVSVLAVDDEDRVFLVQQYRASVDADLIELPAGKRDVDAEPPVETARRELVEEVGVAAGSIELLTTIHHSAGFCDEYGYIYLASDLTEVPADRQGPEEEKMQVLRIAFDEAVDMCLDGRITDAKTKAGVLALHARRSRNGVGIAG